MKSKVANKSKVATIIATILISSIFTVTSSLIFNNGANALLQQLQFPKSQQLDLKAINSGKPPTTSNFDLIKGYTIQPVLWNLTLPSAITFDDKGNMYIAEGGHSYGGVAASAKNT